MRMGRQESSFLSISFTLRCPKSNALAAPRVGIIVIIVSRQRQQGAAPLCQNSSPGFLIIIFFILYLCVPCVCVRSSPLSPFLFFFFLLFDYIPSVNLTISNHYRLAHPVQKPHYICLDRFTVCPSDDTPQKQPQHKKIKERKSGKKRI